jgi:hypothetical protein
MSIRSVSVSKQEAINLGLDIDNIEKFPLETKQYNILKLFEQLDIVLNDTEKNGDITKLYIPTKDSEYVWIYYPLISE